MGQGVLLDPSDDKSWDEFEPPIEIGPDDSDE